MEQQKTQAGSGADELRGAHVLLVEDDRFVRDIYMTKLKQENFRITVSVDGKQAIDALETEVPDLILLDIILPYMDGMEVLKRVKERDAWKNVPVILLTNISDREHIQKGLELGAEDYIIKSHFTPSEVLQKVKSLLERRK